MRCGFSWEFKIATDCPPATFNMPKSQPTIISNTYDGALYQSDQIISMPTGFISIGRILNINTPSAKKNWILK